MRNRVYLIILLFAFCLTTKAKRDIKFLYDTDFLFFFDNREFDNTPYSQSGTLFGTQLSPTIGVGIYNDSIGEKHQLMAGVSYIQPIGTNYKDAQLHPIVYYHLNKSGFDVNLGFVPYTKLENALPDYMRYDSIAYFHPNIQGALVKYKSDKGYVELLCDWRGLMADSTREAFEVVLSGRYDYKFFQVGGYGKMNHLANSKSTWYGVCDDVLINPYIGFDVSDYTPLDSLSIQAGYIFSLQQERKTKELSMASAGYLSLFLRWRFIGFKNTLFVGDNLFPLYPRYSALLTQGDPFYQANIYNRTDIFFYIYNNNFVNCYASFNIQLTDHGGFNCSQQVIAQFNLSEVFDKTNKKKLRTVLGK